MKRAASEIAQLTIEVRKLRHAVERTTQALLSGRDAAKYLGYSHPVFYRLVNRGIVPQTHLDDDMQPRYSRAALDRLIELLTPAPGDIQ